jgi:hypothetical protein
MSILSRFKHWKTTLGSTALGAAGAAVIMEILTEAGCNFEEVKWAGIATYAFTQLQGLLSTDNGKTA